MIDAAKLHVLVEHGFQVGTADNPSMPDRTVRAFQAAWWGDGTEPLAVDGILGPKTTRALQWLPRLSEHFTVWELWDHRAHECYVKRELVGALEKLRRQCGRPLVLSSGYRSPATNDLVGGVGRSVHMLGGAADLNTHVWLTEVQAAKCFSGIGCNHGGNNPLVRHVDVRHAVPGNPTPGASVASPARWFYS